MFAMLAFAADVRVRAVNASESADVLKAGYVYHFANLVEWPASVAPSGRPIVIGVLGNDDFATVLSGVVERKTLDDRTYVVKRLTSGDLKACACHILFVGGAYGEGTADIVALQNSASVLTIAEASDFARHGGIVSLTVDHRRVRLAVNVDAAGIEPDCSCVQGVCGTCETRVLDGVPDHRDVILTPEERAGNRTMMICVSGARTARLVLDI